MYFIYLLGEVSRSAPLMPFSLIKHYAYFVTLIM